MSNYRILANRTLSGAIEREELDDNSIRYTNVALLDRGVWTDSGSGKPTEYDPAELEVASEAPVNIMHNSESEASQAGYIEADSWHVENGTGYANVVLDLSTSAGQYADETLQETLESGGEVGFGGPSIEIPANGYDLEDTPNGYPKLVNGTIEGMGFVKDPASKSTSFARQTAERGVAMSADSQTTKVYTLKDGGMSGQLDLEAIREQYNLSENVDADTIKELVEAGAISLEEDGKEEEEDEEEEAVESEDDDEEPPEEEEADEDEMDMEEVMSEVAALKTEVEELRQEHEALMEADAIQEELSAVREELADAETVTELKEAKEELDKRLSEVEDTPVDPKTLADNDNSSEDWKEWASASGTPETSPNSMR